MPSVWRGIDGDSLTGSFTVYTSCQTNMFDRIGGMFGSLVFPGLKEYIFTSLKKMKTSHLYNAAGAHYNTIEPCQSNFVRVNRPGGSMRSGLYKYLKPDQSQSKGIRLRIKRLCVLCCFRAAKNAAVNSNTTYIMSIAI